MTKSEGAKSEAIWIHENILMRGQSTHKRAFTIRDDSRSPSANLDGVLYSMLASYVGLRSYSFDAEFEPDWTNQYGAGSLGMSFIDQP